MTEYTPDRDTLYDLADRFVATNVAKREAETWGQHDRRRFREFLTANRDAVLRALGCHWQTYGERGRWITDWKDITDE